MAQLNRLRSDEETDQRVGAKRRWRAGSGDSSCPSLRTQCRGARAASESGPSGVNSLDYRPSGTRSKMNWRWIVDNPEVGGDREGGGGMTRRALLAAAGAVAAQAQQKVGPPPHWKGPKVFLDYDQVELDSMYDQTVYAPNSIEVRQGYISNSDLARSRLGAPLRVAYGPSEIEKLDIFRAQGGNAPVHVFIHGGAWRSGAAREYCFLPDLFVAARRALCGSGFRAGAGRRRQSGVHGTAGAEGYSVGLRSRRYVRRRRPASFREWSVFRRALGARRSRCFRRGPCAARCS